MGVHRQSAALALLFMTVAACARATGPDATAASTSTVGFSACAPQILSDVSVSGTSALPVHLKQGTTQADVERILGLYSVTPQSAPRLTSLGIRGITDVDCAAGTFSVLIDRSAGEGARLAVTADLLAHSEVESVG